jgi:DNA polymerase elongation subunit (family B)
MIDNINKLLFLDIETVGLYYDLDDLHHQSPQLHRVWEDSGYEYFKRQYPEDSELTSDNMFMKRAGLLAEFGKIVCVSVGFVLENGETKLDSFTGEEKEILTKCSSLLKRVDKLGFLICGHNVKNFDLPYIGKRMIINGITVPSIVPNYKIKPWESRVLDTKEVWNFNSYRGLSSLELVCASLEIPNPKDNEVNGANLHSFYYNEKSTKEERIEKIKNYCEKDVLSLIKFVQKIK